jgi:hypothetical protein
MGRGHLMRSADSGPEQVFRAEAVAEGAVSGSGERVRMVLGTFSSARPGRVLRWMRGQALRIADGLDPYPSQPIPAAALRPVPARYSAAVGDVPTEMRSWALRDGRRNAARRRLLAGAPVVVLTGDDTGWYAIIAWPVAESAPESPLTRPATVRLTASSAARHPYGPASDSHLPDLGRNV